MDCSTVSRFPRFWVGVEKLSDAVRVAVIFLDEVFFGAFSFEVGVLIFLFALELVLLVVLVGRVGFSDVLFVLSAVAAAAAAAAIEEVESLRVRRILVGPLDV